MQGITYVYNVTDAVFDFTAETATHLSLDRKECLATATWAYNHLI